jgi:hypothetical protein
LHRAIIEHVNAEICLGNISNLETAIQWLKASFMWVRMHKNPKHYGLDAVVSDQQLEGTSALGVFRAFLTLLF